MHDENKSEQPVLSFRMHRLFHQRLERIAKLERRENKSQMGRIFIEDAIAAKEKEFIDKGVKLEPLEKRA